MSPNHIITILIDVASVVLKLVLGFVSFRAFLAGPGLLNVEPVTLHTKTGALNQKNTQGPKSFSFLD